MSAPPVGWSLPVTITRVIDGDTIEVTTTRTLRIRMRDCWCPESRTRNAAEKKRGLAAKEHLKSLAEGKTATLFIPTDSGGDVAQVMTLGRVLGEVWLTGEGQSLSEQMRKAGHATRNKGE